MYLTTRYVITELGAQKQMVLNHYNFAEITQRERFPLSELDELTLSYVVASVGVEKIGEYWELKELWMGERDQAPTWSDVLAYLEGMNAK